MGEIIAMLCQWKDLLGKRQLLDNQIRNIAKRFNEDEMVGKMREFAMERVKKVEWSGDRNPHEMFVAIIKDEDLANLFCFCKYLRLSLTDNGKIFLMKGTKENEYKIINRDIYENRIISYIEFFKEHNISYDMRETREWIKKYQRLIAYNQAKLEEWELGIEGDEQL